MKLYYLMKHEYKAYLHYLEKNRRNPVVIEAVKIILDESKPIEALTSCIVALQTLKESKTPEAIDALYFLAVCSEMGFCVSRNPKLAVDFYLLAAKAGYAPAQYKIAQFYESGRFILPKDPEQALELYKLAVAQGYALAEFHLGYYYHKGNFSEFADGVKKDEKLAFELIGRAATQGYALAQQSLGYTYEMGSVFVEPEPSHSFVESVYWQGFGVENDFKKSAEFYELAATQGFCEAQYRLGSLFERGLGVVKDEKRAVELYQLATESGAFHSHAKIRVPIEKERLGEINTPGDNGDRVVNTTVGRALLVRPKWAVSKLCVCYELGFGVEIDSNRIILLNQSRNALDGKKTHKFQTEAGVDFPALEAAVTHYSQSAFSTDVTAISTLGFCYHLGLGITRDLMMAEKYYKTALRLGKISSLWDLLFCYKARVANGLELKFVIEYFEALSSEHRHAKEALLCLAYLYEYGVNGVGRDLFKAHRHYQRALALEVGNENIAKKVGSFLPLLDAQRATQTLLTDAFAVRTSSMPCTSMLSPLVEIMSQYSAEVR